MTDDLCGGSGDRKNFCSEHSRVLSSLHISLFTCRDCKLCLRLTIVLPRGPQKPLVPNIVLRVQTQHRRARIVLIYHSAFIMPPRPICRRCGRNGCNCAGIRGCGCDQHCLCRTRLHATEPSSEQDLPQEGGGNEEVMVKSSENNSTDGTPDTTPKDGDTASASDAKGTSD
ncbi:hypothetical protein BD779DRAFT_1541956 [Infundibulicybe gibba]|nr:hypothetical protein BD779DRAFT_1541956 [Infundibulicybe gibba]